LFAYFAGKKLVSRIFRGGDEFMTEYANRHNTLFGTLYGNILVIVPFCGNVHKISCDRAIWECYTEKFLISSLLVSAKFSVRHFDKIPKSLGLKAFQRL
jgi:hypothetical protein